MPQVFINKTTSKKQYQKYKQQKENKKRTQERGEMAMSGETNKTTSMNNVYKTIRKV